ncbi:GspE/PulE family protein [Leeuwenhoekiella sp. H156]|uniref:GspE/PulE family protein n=1 Tax=Leeuwenhoekiella sp. H156 TaxID=3450128 RepID=UPI003FA47568
MKSIDFDIPIEIQQIIASDEAFAYRAVPLGYTNSSYQFITDRQDLEKIKIELQVILGIPLTIRQESSIVIDKLLSTNYRRSTSEEAQAISYTQDFLEKILLTAKSIGSSDVHFEPYENKCRVRYRLDGKLKEQFFIPIDEYPIIINKIKNKASLDIAQNRLPQDGRITMQLGNTEFDIRVSTLRTLHGESIVLRILSKDTSNIHLADLGFTADELKTYKEAIKSPNGIVLISGPTGSGKTTTLYATLKLLNAPSTKILTIEDPIEYTLEGVNQVQLREDIGLDFASAMRTFLRQDPDVIMVGEIRDVKTANMAIRAALTGHLVLSTIHTNSAWATVSRLIDMGVPPFLIASTLNISIAQRLVRKLCIVCKTEAPINKDEFPKNYKIPDNLITHYIAKGCKHCHQTGYSGRIAIYEIIPIGNDLKNAIKSEKLNIDSYLKQNNIPQLGDHAERLIKEGLTSLDEVFSLLVNEI